MGIDPGLAQTGVAVIEGTALLFGHVIKTPGREGLNKISSTERIQRILRELIGIQQTYEVAHVSVEKFVYHGHSTTQTHIMPMLVGALLALSFLPPFPRLMLHDPLKWGKQLTGKVSRTKQDVAFVVNLRLGTSVSAKKGGHLTDAMGLAIVCQDDTAAGIRPALVTGTRSLPA